MKFDSKKIALSALAASLTVAFTACGGGGGGSSSGGGNGGGGDNGINCSSVDYTVPSQTTLSGDLTNHYHLTSNQTWVLEGLVAVKGACLKIDAGTTIAGTNGTGPNTSYLVIDKDAKIIAEGTAAAPIIFTSKDAVDGLEPAVGQWGGLTIIGTAANEQVSAYEVNTDFEADSTDLEGSSGTLTHVHILNSGITMEEDKEINGLSLVGVGSGTTIENITVDNSDDDGIELWGGTVDLTNVYVTRCTDDYFDIDDGYAGTVTNLNIIANEFDGKVGNAAIEMSGTTDATFNNLTIVQNASGKEGGIYFKKDAIGGHFNNAVIIDNVTDGNGAIHSKSGDESSDTVAIANTTFTNVSVEGSSSDDRFTGTSASSLETKFNAGTGNLDGFSVVPSTSALTGVVDTNVKLTAANSPYEVSGLLSIEDGAIVMIEPGVTMAGVNGTGASTSYIVVDKGSMVIADGTEANPIIFTSKDSLSGPAAVGQWGGVTLIGTASNDQVNPYEVNTAFEADATWMYGSSGVYRYVEILNSGITMEEDKEINGLSLVGVGSGTVVENITVDNSDDDGIELWGGTVNLSHLSITRCTDDYFDIDDGFSGKVTDLNITADAFDGKEGNAAIEMSGTTSATFDGFNIVQNASGKEGGIYFKKDAIGGHFMNGTVTDNVDDSNAAIHSKSGDETSDTVDIANTSFENVTLDGTADDSRFSGTSAASLQTKFNAGSGNNAVVAP